MSYRVDILDKNLSFVTTVRNLAPLSGGGGLHTGTPRSGGLQHFLQYGHVLSGIGMARFRVGTKDPFFEAVGDVLQPFANHVRITRDGVSVWQGVISGNPARNPFYVDVQAKTYLWLLNKVLIQHDPVDGFGGQNYWTIKSGTLADAVRAVINNAKSTMGAPLSNLTLGEIDNPNFPVDPAGKAQMQDDSGQDLTGPWTFSDKFQVKFDRRTAFYVLHLMGIYCNFDFEITDQMVVNFKSYIGNKQPQLVFSYSRSQPERNNITTYNVPLNGETVVTDLWGVAADNNNVLITTDVQDNAAVSKYGTLQDIAAFSDVKSTPLLQARLRQELPLVSTPDTELHLVPNQRAYPFGRYGLGDTITANVQDGPLISVNEPRRVVGIDVMVQDTGYEDINLITNQPRPDQ